MRDGDVRPAQVVTRHRDMGRAYRQGRHRRVGCQRCQLLCLHIADLSYRFWIKANNFHGLFEFLLHYVATIILAYIEI